MLVFIDAGHGGINPETGKYVTPGKRFYHEKEDIQIYEGVANRVIADKLSEILTECGMENLKTYHPWRDTKLSERVEIVNSVSPKIKNCVVVSIHCNAGGGTGHEHWCYGSEKGLKLAINIEGEFCREFTEVIIASGKPYKKLKLRSRGVKINKTWDILEKTIHPAVLIECGFMDDIDDTKLILDHPGGFARAIATGLFDYRVNNCLNILK